ncbi:hypothetical protein VUJ46_05205 [Chryseobacterium sp. MYb264]|uniref:hypothetical protein n=1 Tax=Chryseobacterium sp. MYb264 TaxID=2745153 RepID=UPI002E111235|nr:hypothetical protein VUJ46_05205 [Chryseobacterium sp. MYb264]
MNFKIKLLLIAGMMSLHAHAQTETGVYFSNDRKFREILKNPGNPLEGYPVMIVKIKASQSGSYFWYLNESKATKKSFFDDHPKDLHAGIYLQEPGGLLPVITFKDFAEGLAQPRYLINHCEIADADKDGFPEFYLTYFTDSDGLDAKPLKVIVYTKKSRTSFQKSKITGWLSFQPEDPYREEKDQHFKSLPAAVQMKAQKIIKDAKKELL